MYTHRDPAKLLSSWEGKTIHRADAIVMRSFDPGFVDDAAALVERRNAVTVSVTEGHLYLELNGTSLSTAVHDHALV